MIGDYTDKVLADWQLVKPELDATTTAVVSRVTRLAAYLEAQFAETVSRFGLSGKGDYDTLAALRRAKPNSALSPTQLADAAMITTGGMTSRIDRLEQAGYVERHTDPSDRRGLLVHLTKSGRRVVDETFEANLEWQRRLLADVSESERAALAHTLRGLLLRLGDG